MARKTTKKTTTKKAPASKKTTTKKGGRKPKATKKAPVEEPVVVEEAPVEAEASVETEASAEVEASSETDASAEAEEPAEAEPSEFDHLMTAFGTALDSISALGDQVKALKREITSLRSKARAVERLHVKETNKLASTNRALDKKLNKRRNANRRTGGVVRQMYLSDTLADFLGKDRGSQIRSCDVTKEISYYVNNKKLNLDKKTKKPIGHLTFNTDAKLRKVLGLDSKTKTLTYGDLQKYTKNHLSLEPVSA